MNRTVFMLLLLINCLFTSGLHAQTQNDAYSDSLIRIAQKQPKDTVRLSAIINLYKLYFNQGDYHTSLQYCLEALQLGRQLKSTNRLPRIIYSIGLNYVNLNRYDSAEFYIDQAEKLAKETGDIELEVQCYNANALICSYQSDHSTAVEYLMKSVEILEKSTNPDHKKWLPQAYGNIGHNLIQENQLEKGIEYEKKLLTYKNYPDEARHATLTCLDIFDAYIQLNKPEEAKKYLDSAIHFSQQLNNVIINTFVANNQGYYYQVINDLPKALLYYQLAYRLADSTKNNFLKAQVADNISNIHFENKNYAEAEKFSFISNELARKLKKLQNCGRYI